MSTSKTTKEHTVPTTRIYLNAGGVSIRVIDFVVGYNNPNINLYQLETDDQYNYGQDYENFAPFFIEIKNQPQEEINKFINQLALVYPIEVNYNYTPDGDPKKQEKKKKYSLVSKKSASSSSNNGKSTNSSNSKSKTYGDIIIEEIVDEEEEEEEDTETEEDIPTTTTNKSK